MDCSQQEDDPCYTCGSSVSKHVIISCSRCGDRQHLWCMRPMLLDIPSTWCCDECQENSFSPTLVNDVVSLPGTPTVPSVHSTRHQKVRIEEPKRGKVKFLPASEAACLLPGDTRNHFLTTRIPNRKRSRHYGRSTLTTLGSPVKPSAPVRDFCELAEALRENREIKRKGKEKEKKADDTVKKPFRPPVPSIIPGDGSSDKKVTGHEDKWTDEMKHKQWAIIEKHTKNPIQTYAIWSGQFEILDDPDCGIHCGLQAFIPRWVELKAYFFSLNLPSSLSFKLISRNVPWDQLFKDNPPDENDVVLYMLPKLSDRCREPYKHVIDMLDSSDYAMQTYIDGVELIVFTSKWLETCAVAESEGQNFLWGLYRDRVHECIIIDKKCSIPINIDNEKINVVEDMQLDEVDEAGTAPQEVTVSKESKSSGHEGTRKAIKEELLEFPPGFEAQHYGKKRKF